MRGSIPPEEKDVRIHRISVPVTQSSSQEGPMPVTTKEVALDMKLLRMALTASPSECTIGSHWPIDKSHLEKNVKAALRFALGHPPCGKNIEYIRPSDDLLKVKLDDSRPLTANQRDVLHSKEDLMTKARKHTYVFRVTQPHKDEYDLAEETRVENLSDGTDPLECRVARIILWQLGVYSAQRAWTWQHRGEASQGGGHIQYGVYGL